MAKSGGRHVLVQVDGKPVSCVTIGALAAAVGRSVPTVRRWERQGLIPSAPLRVVSENIHLQRRLYPVELVQELQQVAIREQFGRRRPSGMFLQQQEGLWQAWGAVIDPLFESDGVTSRHPLDE